MVKNWVLEPKAVNLGNPNEATSESDADKSQRWTVRLPVTAPPEFGFAPLAYAWAQGVDLDDLIDNVPLSPGDFVRIVRQLLDLVRQVRDAEPRLGGIATSTLERLDRGIVMTGGPG